MTVSENLEVLSERELEVLKLVATGATNQQIARVLVISPNTVKVHLRNIFEKLGVQSRTEATMEAVRRGWVHVPGEVGAEPLSAPPAAAERTTTELAAPASAIPALPPIPLPELMPHAPAHKPVARWQRGLLVVVLLLAIAGAALPAWLTSRSAAANLTAFTDVGRAQVSPPERIVLPRWNSSALLPTPVSRLALAADGARLYAIGGETVDGVTGAVTIYDPQTNGWLPGTAKPSPVANIGAAAIGGRIYVPGGSTPIGGVSDALEIYDPAADAWSSGPSLPRPLAAYALATWHDKLYLFGGWDGSAYRSEILIFDPAAGVWVEGPAMPGPRAFAGATTLKDIIYVVGGADGQNALSDLLAFDPAADAAEASPWVRKASLKEPRAGLGVVAVGSQVFAIGGNRSAGETFNEQYDTRLDAWSRLGTPIAGAWRNLAAVAHNNRIHVIGGWSGAYLDVHERYTALIQLLLPMTTQGQSKP